MDTDMSRDVLMIAAFEGATNCARAIESQLGSRVEVATNRRAGLIALRRAEYGVVVIEESFSESDPEWADTLWQSLGTAMPLEVNVSICGVGRLIREVKSALARRDGQQVIAHRAATEEIRNTLKSSLTGLLLQSELALNEPAISASLEPKLRHLVELAGAMREQLQ